MPRPHVIPLAEIQDALSVLLCFEPPEGVNYEIATRAVGHDFAVCVKLWAIDDDIHVYDVISPPSKCTLNALIDAAERILEAAWEAPAVTACQGATVVKALDITRMGRDQ